MPHKPVVTLILLTLIGSRGVHAVTFTQTRTLGPVRASYTQLATAVDHINAFLAETNGKSPHASLEITISSSVELFPGKESSQVAFGDRLNAAIAAESIPVAHTFNYTYICSDCRAISRVTIEFHDFQRKITVAGPSFEHVSALAGLANEQLAPLAHGVGGLAARGVAGVVIFCISFVMQGVGLLLQLPSLRVGPRWLPMTLSIVGLAIIIAYWAAPTIEWFPGVAIYGSSPSFMTRYAPEVTFWGAVGSIAISIAGVVISVYLARRQKQGA